MGFLYVIEECGYGGRVVNIVGLLSDWIVGV